MEAARDCFITVAKHITRVRHQLPFTGRREYLDAVELLRIVFAGSFLAFPAK